MADLPDGCTRAIMTCLDNSNYSEEAFNYYYNNIHKPGDFVFVAHVASMHPPVAVQSMASPEWNEKIEKHKARLHDFEEKWQTKLSSLNIPGEIDVLAMEYGVGDTICKAAKKRNINMIISGQRGMGIVRRTILGSTSDYILHHAHCPVLIVPKHHGDKDVHVTCPEQQQEQ